MRVRDQGGGDNWTVSFGSRLYFPVLVFCTTKGGLCIFPLLRE